jgi:hypothetical protein
LAVNITGDYKIILDMGQLGELFENLEPFMWLCGSVEMKAVSIEAPE